MNKKRAKSQITTILIFIMAALFLFALISINISRVSQKKTAISNLTDTVGLRVASQLGSQANALKQQFEIYGDKVNEWGEPENCDVNWKLVWGGLLIVAGAALIWIPGVGAWGVAAGIVLVVGGIASGVFGGIQQYTAHNQGAQEQLKLKFKELSGFQQIVEAPVYGVLSALTDDPALVKDEFDMDRDNEKTDYIPRFFKWYVFRLDSFDAIGPWYEKFYNEFFAKNRFYFKEDKNGMVMKREKYNPKKPAGPNNDPERPNSEPWWVDWQVDYSGGQKVKLVPWLNNELKPMLATMRQYGFGINGTEKDGVIVDLNDSGWKTYEELIGLWVNEIESFENIIARGLYDLDRDSAIGGMDQWLDFMVYQKNTKLCPGAKDEKDQNYKDWFTRLGILEGYAVELKLKLLERKSEIHDCIANCMTITWQCCSCCGDAFLQPKEKKSSLLAYNQAGIFSVYDVGGGILSSNGNLILAENGGGGGGDGGGGGGNGGNGGNGDGDDGGEKCSPSFGCCGPEVPCGQECERCGSSHSCTTYTPPGSTNCCSVLPLEPYCSNNIVDIGVGIHAPIQVLDSFIADVEELRVATIDFYNKVQEINRTSYDKMHEAFYVWKDKVGSATAQEQEVGHIAYAKFELDDPVCFALPSIKHRSTVQWDCVGVKIGGGCLGFWVPLPKTCASVRNATGEFTLTVARFDEDTAKKGPLSRFWTFRFGKKGVSEGDAAFVREKAKELLGPKGNISSFFQFSDADKERLRGILRNGIVSKVRMHYGPGHTYKEEEKKKGKAKASLENKDIYIKWASSDFDKK